MSPAASPAGAAAAPRVSVLVSHFDRAAWLPEALASVRAQRFHDYEIVVIDDAGPDPAGAARTASAFDAHCLRHETNGGVARARNAGVAAARGELVAFLDDDDLWRPDHLAGLVAALDAAPAAQLAYADAEVWRLARPEGAAGRAPATWPVTARLPLAVAFDAGDLARDDFIVPGALLFRRTLYERVGAFDESLYVSDDWDWLLRVFEAYGSEAFVRRPGASMVVRIVGDAAGNLSADFGARRLAALAEIERRHGTPRLTPKTFWEVAETYAARARTR